MTELAIFKDERKRTFLNAEGSDKPLKSPLGQDVLDRARAYLERAAALGLPRVYLIHGVGKGRLRAELDALLRRHPHVKGHHHGYFAKYGFGATEVELGD